MSDTPPRSRAFHHLHRSGCFVISNPWDVGSARLLTQLGFKALATTSSGFAWSQGRTDNAMSLDETFGGLHRRTTGSGGDDVGLSVLAGGLSVRARRA